ncbi:MAG: hypothetical protein OXK21_07205 [Chloroflexota bacterium]|nr:hypothetical protein [Chloroflexota bacterium]
MAERIYLRGEDGGLEPLEEKPFTTEDELQQLLAEHPELLDGEQMRPGDPRRWILITREQAIGGWALDHLIVDQDAVPTLVDVKRGSNTEIRRTIVGQLLEYAAHAAENWTAEELRRTFEESQARPDEALSRLLKSDGEPDADQFWQSVATNLAARRLRLLFVADEIPDPLERVAKFLNEQMPSIEVLAVEIKQFRGPRGQTLVPRVMGRIADIRKPGTRRPPHTRNSFLDAFPDAADREVAERLLDGAVKAGATLTWGSSSVSIRAKCPLWGTFPITVALLTPPGAFGGWPGEGLTNVHFGEAVSSHNPRPDEAILTVLERYKTSFKEEGFTRADGEERRGWTASYSDLKAHVDVMVKRLENVVRELGALQ